jgi:hypothetical protein
LGIKDTRFLSTELASGATDRYQTDKKQQHIFESCPWVVGGQGVNETTLVISTGAQCVGLQLR